MSISAKNWTRRVVVIHCGIEKRGWISTPCVFLEDALADRQIVGFRLLLTEHRLNPRCVPLSSSRNHCRTTMQIVFYRLRDSL
ncbi:hypothetical protein KCP75_13570 [Salmonella enterica subsp. enterica]|nr:hypothetical protein KCP75_13570 [Salmonella enterica subsp. enterica]